MRYRLIVAVLSTVLSGCATGTISQKKDIPNFKKEGRGKSSPLILSDDERRGPSLTISTPFIVNTTKRTNEENTVLGVDIPVNTSSDNCLHMQLTAGTVGSYGLAITPQIMCKGSLPIKESSELEGSFALGINNYVTALDNKEKEDIDYDISPYALVDGVFTEIIPFKDQSVNISFHAGAKVYLLPPKFNKEGEGFYRNTFQPKVGIGASLNGPEPIAGERVQLKIGGVFYYYPTDGVALNLNAEIKF